MNKWLVEYTHGSLQVAGVTSGHTLGYESAFAFQVSDTVNLEELAQAIEKIQEMRANHENGYWQECFIKVGENLYVNKLKGCMCSITINNYRVLYAGLIDRLNGLPKALRKAQEKLDKESEYE